MKLYLLRHGEADWHAWKQDDNLRPLTEKGKEELRRIAQFFKEIGVEPAVVFSSPLPRARQTAEIIHQKIGGELKVAPELSPGFAPHQIGVLCKGERRDVMLVGHEPDLSESIRHFTGARAKMSKAGAARLDFDESGKARLIWLVPPKISAR